MVRVYRVDSWNADQGRWQYEGMFSAWMAAYSYAALLHSEGIVARINATEQRA